LQGTMDHVEVANAENSGELPAGRQQG
jgi:hypothetical protein